mgnify:CR=1 FL=1
MDLMPVKGTRDFFPDQMRVRKWLFQVWRSVSEQAGFEEYDTCPLEHEEIYLRKAGDEISKQLYNFEDKAGRRLSLRPEMTPSLARLVLRKQKSLSFPLKWFSIPQCFRYERMTKGRRREHFQWNADIIGENDIVAEAEILILLISACESMGLSSINIRVFINDRRILNSILNTLNVPQKLHGEILIIIDKRDKVSPDTLEKMLKEVGMDSSKVNQLNEFLSISTLEKLKDRIQNTEAIDELEHLLKLMDNSGYGDYIQFDISIVRGLSYYTGSVFEINSPGKHHRAICGGGRYDSLLSTYGGEIIPAVGFGFGDVVIQDVLEELKLFPKLRRKLDYMIFPFDNEHTGMALNIAKSLRSKGFNVDCNFGMKKIKKSLQQANESDVKFAILIFPEELSENKVVIRDMKLREQKIIKINDLISLPERTR